jgi:N-carbamoylputrescine amidase
MYEQSVDLMLQPHSSPALTPNKLTPQKTVESFKTALEKRAMMYAGMLGIPVIFCNHSGKFATPMPGIPFLKQDTHFDGLSSIADSDGTLKAQLGGEEGVIVEDVTLDPSLKKKEPPTTYGRFALPDAHWTRNVVLLIEAAYSACYWFSRERKRRAREISQC